MRAPLILSAWIFALPALATVPASQGQCVATKIASIGTRLDGVTDSGDHVRFANGVLHVSYAAIPHLKGARVGDAVKLCLISVPDDCPPADDCGKVYRATDLRTKKTWDAPNAEHMCGGA